jgi:hypothetical protein
MIAKHMTLGTTLPNLVLLLLLVSWFPGCSEVAHNTRQDRVLQVTYGGFLKGGSEAERIEGVCNPDVTRTLLECDLYNGLRNWTLSEVTLIVLKSSPSGWDQPGRTFRIPVTIRPLTTEHVTVRLGLELPERWQWQNVGARGYPVE